MECRDPRGHLVWTELPGRMETLDLQAMKDHRCVSHTVHSAVFLHLVVSESCRVTLGQREVRERRELV